MQAGNAVPRPTNSGQQPRPSPAMAAAPPSFLSASSTLPGDTGPALVPQAGGESERLVTCHLLVPRYVGHGRRLVVVGNVRQLGAWRPAQGVQLQRGGGDEHMYSASVQLPLGEKIEAKVRWLRGSV